MDNTNVSVEKSKVKIKSKDVLDLNLQRHSDSTMVLSVKSPSQTFNNRSPSVSSITSNTSSRIAVRVSRNHMAPDGIAANSLGSSLNVPAERPPSQKVSSIGSHRSPLIQSSQPTASGKNSAGLSTHLQGPTTLKNAEGKVLSYKKPMVTARLSSSKVVLHSERGLNQRHPTHGSATTLSKDHPSKLRVLKGAQTHVKPVSHSDNLSIGTAREISRLEALCESRTKELNFVRLQLKHCALGFDSMAILLQYLIETVGAFSVPSLNQEVQHIQRKWQATHAGLEEAKAIQKSIAEKLVEQQKEHAAELLKMNSEFEQRMTEVQQRLSMDCLNSIDALKFEHQKELDSLKDVHSDEMADIRDFYQKQENSIKRVHQEELKQIQEMVLNKKDELSSMLSDRTKLDSLDKSCEEMDKLRSKIQELTSQCSDLERMKSEYQYTLAHDSDTRVQIISARNVELQKEVESLKVVLELRQTDVLELRRKNESFILQAEELVKANEEIKRLRAKKEDLEALVEQKAIAERQLSIENERLKDYHEKESNISKRLSMENEELQWRLRQGKEMSVSMSMTEGTSFDMAFNKSGAPSSMSMYFWDNEGLTNSGICPFSQFRTSGPPWKSPQSSPHLSPSKSPQSAAKRPASAHIIRKERVGSSSSKRLSSASEDENILDWEDVPVRLRKKKSSLSDNFETNLKADVLGTAVEESRGEADGIEGDSKSLVTVVHNETITSVLEDVELNVGSCAGSEFSTDGTSPEFQADKSGDASSELILELNDTSATSAGVEVNSKLVDDFIEVDHNRNSVLNLSHEPLISYGTNDVEFTSETWTKWSRDSRKCSLLSSKFIAGDNVEWTTAEIEKLQSTEFHGQLQNVTTNTSFQESNPQHCEVVEDEDLISTVLIWKPKSQVESSANSAAPPSLRHYGHNASIELIQTSSSMDVLPQGPCQDKVDDDVSRTSSGEDLPEDTLSMESLVVGAPFEGSPFDILSDEYSSMKTAGAMCDPFLQDTQGVENDTELTKSPKKTTTLVITYRASRPSISSSRDSSPVNQLGCGTSTAGSDLSDSSGTDSSSSSSCRASPVGGEPLPNKVIKLLENSMFTGTRSPRTSAGESMMMFDDCTSGAPTSSDPSHVLLKKVLQDHLLLENGGSRLCSNSIDSCSNREQSLGGSPLPVLSKPDTPDMIDHPSVDVPNASTADESWSDDDDLPSESEV